MKFIVDQLFPAREVHLTGGASGSGKTTLEGQLIEDWRKGKPVWDMPSFPVPFCYIACDRSLQSIQATLDRIDVNHKEWPLLSLVDYTHGSSGSPNMILQLARGLVSDVQVIWLDGIQALCPGGKINDYITVSTFLIALTRMCQRENITIKGLAHATKVKEGERFPDPRQRILGSVAWAGFSDTLTIVDRVNAEDPKDTTRLVHVLPRNAEELMVRYEFVGGRMVEVVDAGQFILDTWLSSFPVGSDVSAAAILAEADRVKISKSTAFRWIKRQVTDGKLIKTGHGDYQVPRNS